MNVSIFSYFDHYISKSVSRLVSPITSLTHLRAFSIDSIAMSVLCSISQTPMLENLAGEEGAKENDLEVDNGNGCDANVEEEEGNGCQGCHRIGGGASLSALTILHFLIGSMILD